MDLLFLWWGPIRALVAFALDFASPNLNTDFTQLFRSGIQESIIVYACRKYEFERK